MKQSIIVIALSLLSLYCFGQANTFPLEGNVGVGTIHPEQKLTVLMDVSENGSGIAVKAINNGGVGSQPGFNFLNPAGIKRMYSYLDVFSDTYNIGNAIGTNVMTIKQSGNVGFGTITPEQKLTIVMDPAENGTGVAVKAVNSGGPGSQPAVSYLNQQGLKRMYSYLDVSSDTYNIANRSGTTLMTVNQDGNVGVGIRFPTDKLSVNGNIRAREIKVENTNWPDYVFVKNRHLTSLRETEEYIEKYKHLPGIPSAEEVQGNGINVGEINAKLLEKIEELTLHLIEKDKEIKKLEKLNDRVIGIELKIKKLQHK